MDLGLQGKTALITGASKGIGRAITVALASEGVNVAFCGRTGKLLEQLGQEVASLNQGRYLPLQADIQDAAQVVDLVRQTTEQLGNIDIFVCNTGGPPANGRFMDFTGDEIWEQAFHEQVLPVVRLCRQVIPVMQQQGAGRIILITSASTKEPIVDHVLSTSFRLGMLGIAKHLANEHAADGILVNSIGPASILTEKLQAFVDVKARAQRVPLKRLGQSDEVAGIVTFLASNRASYITGNYIAVDGGLTQYLL